MDLACDRQLDIACMSDPGQQPLSHGPGFEATLAAIAARLLGAPLESFDACITDVLFRLVQLLEVERSMFALVDPGDGILRSTHAVAAPGVRPFPVGHRMHETSPWILEQLSEKRVPVVVSSGSDLPPEAGVDAQTIRAFDVRSVALFPIVAGDQLLGAFSFGTTLRERSWPQQLVDRLSLIGQVFAGALLRREQEGKLRGTLTELEALRERLQLENEYLRERTFSAQGFEDIVGESPALRRVLFQAEQVAPTDATVLLLGETGTGKELLARAIHFRSHRRARTLITVNCAALTSTLVESELFGHEKGAFTGASSRKIGRFELADRSTLFLDEVGEIPLNLQAKLLRVLQEGEFERLGSSITHKVDVRVIAASNRDLAAAAREGTFRPDLYYRLRVFPVEVPPLRARRDDIPLLVWYLVGQLGAALGKKVERVPASTMDRLVAYDWPGNVRELRNVLERAIILSPGPGLLLEELGDGICTAVTASDMPDGVRTLEDVERDHILRVLESCDWHVRGPRNAAKQLGLNASTLYSRMKKLGIQRSASTPRRRVGA
jgi:formate hydrogenlyase transcriptional activator